MTHHLAASHHPAAPQLESVPRGLSAPSRIGTSTNSISCVTKLHVQTMATSDVAHSKLSAKTLATERPLLEAARRYNTANLAARRPPGGRARRARLPETGCSFKTRQQLAPPAQHPHAYVESEPHSINHMPAGCPGQTTECEGQPRGPPPAPGGSSSSKATPAARLLFHQVRTSGVHSPWKHAPEPPQSTSHVQLCHPQPHHHRRPAHCGPAGARRSACV